MIILRFSLHQTKKLNTTDQFQLIVIITVFF